MTSKYKIFNLNRGSEVAQAMPYHLTNDKRVKRGNKIIDYFSDKIDSTF